MPVAYVKVVAWQQPVHADDRTVGGAPALILQTDHLPLDRAGMRERRQGIGIGA